MGCHKLHRADNSKAEESIILIDNYVDRNTLEMLSKKNPKIPVSIYTMKRHCELSDKERHDFETQYGPLNIRYTDEFHDRFLILDRKTLYHFGASLKDAGIKTFAIMSGEDEESLKQLLERLLRLWLCIICYLDMVLSSLAGYISLL